MNYNLIKTDFHKLEVNYKEIMVQLINKKHKLDSRKIKITKAVIDSGSYEVLKEYNKIVAVYQENFELARILGHKVEVIKSDSQILMFDFE